jgi:hypothetical protein
LHAKEPTFGGESPRFGRIWPILLGFGPILASQLRKIDDFQIWSLSEMIKKGSKTVIFRHFQAFSVILTDSYINLNRKLATQIHLLSPEECF